MTAELEERTRDGIGPLAEALAKAQAEFPSVTRSKTVRVQTKTGGSYTFSYAPLDAILDAVRPALATHGLALVQLLDEGDLVTLLIHESGGKLEGRTSLPTMTDIQSFGSAITYLRRYAIQALLGIAAEEDDDGNGADGNTVAPARPARAPRPARQGTVPPPISDAEVAELHGADEPDRAAYCLAEDPKLGTGPCALPPEHAGPHKNRGGTWPNR